jgi:hypothetical protein
MTTPETPETPPTPESQTTPEPPATPNPPPASSFGSRLRAPQGCGEWAVVILGIIWVVLGIIFVVALVVRLSG